MNLEYIGVKGELLETKQLLQVDIDGEIEPAFIDGALLQSAGGVADRLADIGGGEFDPFFSKGFGRRPSVVSSTVLSPVSGSAGFKSSVFLSSCAKAAPDHAQTGQGQAGIRA